MELDKIPFLNKYNILEEEYICTLAHLKKVFLHSIKNNTIPFL